MSQEQTSTDTWDPTVYDRFRDERERPVHDLLALVEPAPGGCAVDLGCGTGRYTALLHDRVGADRTLGIDTSARMLADAARWSSERITFDERDLTTVEETWDVIFANASLQWVPDHDRLLPHLASRLAPGGQLAFQVPANFGHATHTVADRLGREYGLEPLDRAIGALSPGRYAEILWAAGLRDLDVTMRVYAIEMSRTDQVIDWVSGSLLTVFDARLPADEFARFRDRYRATVLDELGDPAGDQPYLYAFQRILCRGRRPV